MEALMDWAASALEFLRRFARLGFSNDPPAWLAGLAGALVGLLSSPLLVMINHRWDLRRARRVLYDDIALAYIAVAAAVEEQRDAWEANSKAILDFEGSIMDMFNDDPNKESAEERKRRNRAEAEKLAALAVPKALARLRMIDNERYEYLRASQLMLLFEMNEYRAIRQLYRIIGGVRASNESDLTYIGYFRAIFRNADPKLLIRAIGRVATPAERTMALKALHDDKHVIGVRDLRAM